MSFDWNEYLKLAQELIGKSSTPCNQEARCRSAISRAYYAAFCNARNFLRDVDSDPRINGQGNVHSYVRDKFRRDPDKRRKKIGEDLHRLLQERHTGDYEEREYPNPIITARFAVGLAEQIISNLDALPPKHKKK